MYSALSYLRQESGPFQNWWLCTRTDVKYSSDLFCLCHCGLIKTKTRHADASAQALTHQIYEAILKLNYIYKHIHAMKTRHIRHAYIYINFAWNLFWENTRLLITFLVLWGPLPSVQFVYFETDCTQHTYHLNLKRSGAVNILSLSSPHLSSMSDEGGGISTYICRLSFVWIVVLSRIKYR